MRRGAVGPERETEGALPHNSAVNYCGNIIPRCAAAEGKWERTGAARESPLAKTKGRATRQLPTSLLERIVIWQRCSANCHGSCRSQGHDGFPNGPN